jgi:hypothetical protein
MYTIQTYADVVDKEKRRRIVDVTFTDGVATFVQNFSFSIDTEIDIIKKTVNQYLEELNYVAPEIDDLTPPTEPAPILPTPAELARTEWNADRNNLKTLMELVRDGVFTGTEKQITDLQAKVKADFKVTYLD